MCSMCQSRHSPEASGGPNTRAGGCTQRMLERGARAEEGWLAGLVTLQGTHAGVACSCGTAPHGRDPHWSSLFRSVACGKDTG